MTRPAKVQGMGNMCDLRRERNCKNYLEKDTERGEKLEPFYLTYPKTSETKTSEALPSQCIAFFSLHIT